jgi:PAS domain S-box-containing protein
MQAITDDGAQLLRDRSKLSLYRQIFENSPDGIAVIDPSGAYLEQNAAHAILIGYSDAELVGRTPAIHLGQETFVQIAQALVRTGHYHGEHQSRARDGTIRTIDLSAFGVYDDQCHLLGYVGRKRDITEHKRSQAVLLRRYAQVQSICRMAAAVTRATALPEICEEALACLEASLGCDRAAVLLYDPDGVMRFKACHNLSDEYRAAVEGHSPWHANEQNPQAFGIDDVGLATDLGDYQAVIQNEGITALAFVPLVSQQRLLGKFMLYYDNAHTFTFDELQVAQTIANQIAFTIERQLGEDELKRANAAKSRFLATMSHELRTPLNAILGYTDLLTMGVSGQLSPLQSTHMQRIESSARHLLNVIEDILTFSRAEAQPDEVHAETIDIDALVTESIAMIEAIARHKKLEITAHVPAGLQAVQSDARKLRQIMLNLLSNAVKFTDQGSVALLVVQDGNCTQFAVRDTGPGIAAEHLGRIYEPFWQAEQGATRRAGGTGLGLTVTRQLVELLGGRILVESTPGAGSTFTVELPH